MKPRQAPLIKPPPPPEPPPIIAIQAPLPGFLHTLPKLTTVTGRGGALGRATPSASAEEPANDN